MSWFGIIRLGLVQAALGSVVVLVTSTLNRVMVVEYALPAVLPGLLVALHYAVQLMRPRFGYGSDRGGRCTPWVLGGMATLSIGAVLCAPAAVGFSRAPISALALAIAGYCAVGMGVSAAGTSLLALMAKQVGASRRAAAATIMWVLMVGGFAFTSGMAGRFLDPFSPQRLICVVAVAAAIAFAAAVAAIWGVEETAQRPGAARQPRPEFSFLAALRHVWAEQQARLFTLFVFTSMLAYSAEELLLEPFAGKVFGYTVGESSRLSGSWHASVLLGLIAVGIACSGTRPFGSLRTWTISGCIASAVALLGLACAGIAGPHWPLRPVVAVLGCANGVFAAAAIGSMMELAHRGDTRSAGMRMGLWGAAQAIAFAVGGVVGTFIVDSIRYFFGSPAVAFACMFVTEAALFFVAVVFAVRTSRVRKREPAVHAAPAAA